MFGQNVCPIYNSPMACGEHPNCLFLRQGGCAVVLSAILSDQCNKEVQTLNARVANLENSISQLVYELKNRR